MTLYAVIGQSPFAETSVATGPYKTATRAREVAQDLDGKGWNTELVELERAEDIGYVSNDEDV